MPVSREASPARRRLPRGERERLIIAEAARFFAEVGFEGQTRALARRLGVTQPLLYRYFPDKDALIERVYGEVFEGGWDTEWEACIADRRRPLADRLEEVYAAYTQANFSYERVRLFMYMGLKDHAIGNRYVEFLRAHLFIPVAREIRAATGLPTDAPLDEREIEAVAGLHGAIGYVGLRRWVYETQSEIDVPAAIAVNIRTFLAGAPAACRQWADGR